MKEKKKTQRKKWENDSNNNNNNDDNNDDDKIWQAYIVIQCLCVYNNLIECNTHVYECKLRLYCFVSFNVVWFILFLCGWTFYIRLKNVYNYIEFMNLFAVSFSTL